MLTKIGLGIIGQLYRLPFPFVAWLGRSLGSLGYWVVGSRRRVVLTNLRLCFPALTEKERVRLAKQHFQAVGRSYLERTYPFHSPPEMLAKVVRLEGIEHIEAQMDRPILLLAPHFVGLDMGVIRLSMIYQMTGIYAMQKSSALNDWLFKGRSRFNKPSPISRQQGIRALIREMKPGIPVFYLPDLDYGRKESVFVPFFGIPTATITGLSRLARLTKAAVIPVVVEQKDDGYVTHILPAWTDFPTADPIADTIRMNQFIEDRVRLLPEQYYWVHKRFKTRPEGEPSFYETKKK